MAFLIAYWNAKRRLKMPMFASSLILLVVRATIATPQQGSDPDYSRLWGNLYAALSRAPFPLHLTDSMMTAMIVLLDLMRSLRR
jgi:hypothetical protein